MYKVLIVDDDKPIRYMLKRFQKWKAYGFVIEGEACDGKEALKKLSAKKFDLMLIDIRMPGLDGFELISEIRERNLDVCLMLLSTYSDFEYAQQGIRLGVFDYMTKPVDDNALSTALERIKRHLDEKKSQQARNSGEKKLIEDNLRFYYPKSQESKLTDLIMAGSHKAIDEASITCSEIFNLMDQDLVKTGILLMKMILSLREEFNRAFPWLGALEEVSFDVDLTHAESMDDSKAKFLNYISNMLEVIKKYELHQPDSIVRKTCQYVMEHVEEDIKLDNIANEVYISSSYIGKLFKQKTGINFIDYVTKVKMEHAKHLLGTGKYKNYEISEKLCYSSPDYFCRLFKDYTGYTPIEFKRGAYKSI